MTTNTLRLDGVTKRFGGLMAVRDVTFDVPVGRLTSLVGPNGAGKSTLFACIGGQHLPTSGEITWSGRNITGWAPEAVARTGIARTFQTSRPIPRFSALENVLVGADGFGTTNIIEDLLGSRRRRREDDSFRQRARDALDRVGLAHVADVNAEQLAYGQRRLLEIARALVGEPRLLLLDEPAAGLNSAEAETLGQLLRELVVDGLGVLLVEHNLRLVLSISDAVAVLDFGELIASGPPGEIVRNQRVIDAYIGGGRLDEEAG